MSIFGGPNRGGGGAPNVDVYGNKIIGRGQRPDTSSKAAYGASMSSYVQAPMYQPGGNQLLFPAITTAPLVQTQTVDMNGNPSTKAVIVPSTQSLIPPPSTLLTSHYASLPNLDTRLVPYSQLSAAPASGIYSSPIRRSQYLSGGGLLIGGGDDDQILEKLKKDKLRNELLDQMNDNASKRIEERRIKYLQDEIDESRIYRDRWDQDRRSNYEEWQRKKYLVKDGHIPGVGNYSERWNGYSDYLPPWSTRYDHRYQVSRKGKRKDGNDDYGWWYGAPQTHRYSRRRYRGHWDSAPQPPPLPWLEDKEVLK